MKNWLTIKLQSLVVRRAVTAGLVVFVAIYISQYLSFSEPFWIPISALFIMQSLVGSTGRQSLQRFFVMMLSIILISYLIFWLQFPLELQLMVCCFFSIACYFLWNKGYLKSELDISLMIGLMIVLALFLSTQQQIVYDRLLDVIIGSSLGWVANLIIFPVKVDSEFRQKTIEILNACNQYLAALRLALFDKAAISTLEQKKNQLEKSWENFPDWVYEKGFLAHFQQGHRHFLVRIEQVRQILFILNQFIYYPFPDDLLLVVKAPIQLYLQELINLINAEMTVLQLKTVSEPLNPLSDSFSEIEEALQSNIPLTLDALDLKPEYIYMANFVYQLGELGGMLLALAKALKEAPTSS